VLLQLGNSIIFNEANSLLKLRSTISS